MSLSTDEPPIPVTVVGGYLGAGKTTLLNALLRDADQPFAVLVNDFGSINVDAELIASDDGKTIALANGCICCSLVDGFVAALQEVRSIAPKPARVLVEASGVANPQQVAAYAHAPGFVLDGIVTLVDGAEIDEQLQSELIGDVVQGQIEGADLVIMTKADLVEPDRFRRSRVALIDRFGARVVESAAGFVPGAVIFGPERHEDAAMQFGHADELFETWDERHEEPIDGAELERRLESMPSHIVRVKGFVRFIESPDVSHIVQLVGKRWSITSRGPWDGQPSVLVFIARKESPQSHR